MKINRYIEIVSSSNSELSSMSKESCNSIRRVLAKHYSKVSITIVNNLADLEALAGRQPDLVFLGMEFIPLNTALGLADPAKIWLSEYFDEHNIAYTGSGRAAHELGRNKPLAKQRLLDAGLNTAAFCVTKQQQPLVESDLTLDYPLFIKPANRGGGLGIDSGSVVHNFKQLLSRVRFITTSFHSDSLVEQYLHGREFSVAILKDVYSEDYLVMPIELVAPSDKNGARILSGQVKSANTEEVFRITDMALKTKIVTLALASFEALGARDYGRIDIRLDSNGIANFLEANLIPSLISGYGSFPKACELNMDLEYEPMIKAIAELGLTRNLTEAQYEPSPTLADVAAISLGAV